MNAELEARVSALEAKAQRAENEAEQLKGLLAFVGAQLAGDALGITDGGREVERQQPERPSP